MNECEHGSLPNMCVVDGCVNEAWRVVDDVDPPKQPTVTASYYGACALCPDRICPGDLIIATEDGWAHRDCTA